jgi:hypothetical protein
MNFKFKSYHSKPELSGSYELESFPQCPPICISHSVEIVEGMRGKGLGQKQHLERLDNMRKMGFDHAICTVREDNKVERHILAKNGWKMIDSFMATQSCEEGVVQIWSRSISAFQENKPGSA